jgi:hypothetical protein
VWRGAGGYGVGGRWPLLEGAGGGVLPCYIKYRPKLHCTKHKYGSNYYRIIEVLTIFRIIEVLTIIEL